MLIRCIFILVALHCHCIVTYASSPPNNISITEKWSTPIDSVFSFSSPRATDINNDGIKDIVFGTGVEDAIINLIVCLDGATGDKLWSFNVRNEVFGSPIFYDVNDDMIEDVIINGRDAGLYCIDGSNGSLIWKFFNGPGDPIDFGWYNFYQPQLIEDQTNDGLKDLLAMNGGDKKISEEEPDRNFGYLMIIDISNGQSLVIDTLPDNRESYFNPLVFDIEGDGEYEVLFGTGGETDTGALWLTSLESVAQNQLSTAEQLDGPFPTGFIQPSVIADLTGDHQLDIISYNLGGHMKLFDGVTKEIVWQLEKPGFDFYAAPTICFANTDDIPDLVFIASEGVFDEGYTGFELVVIDGATGTMTTIDTLGEIVQFNSFVAFDSDSNSMSELIGTFNVSGPDGLYHHLVYYDLSDNSKRFLEENHRGYNFASTPFLEDIDQDGFGELIYLFNKNKDDPPVNMTVMCYETNIPKKAIQWHSYMGENYDNVYGIGIPLSNVELSMKSAAIHPNPAMDYLFVDDPLIYRSFAIYNLSGDRVSGGKYTKSIALNMLSAGIYLLVLDASSEQYSTLFVVTE